MKNEIELQNIYGKTMKNKIGFIDKKINWIDWYLCVSNFSKLRTSEVLYPLLLIFMSIIS